MKTPQNDASTDDAAFRRTLLNRLARAAGHLQSIRRMLENGEPLDKIVVQLSAVKAALDGVAKAASRETLERQIESVRRGDDKAEAELRQILAQIFK